MHPIGRQLGARPFPSAFRVIPCAVQRLQQPPRRPKSNRVVTADSSFLFFFFIRFVGRVHVRGEWQISILPSSFRFRLCTFGPWILQYFINQHIVLLLLALRAHYFYHPLLVMACSCIAERSEEDHVPCILTGDFGPSGNRRVRMKSLTAFC